MITSKLGGQGRTTIPAAVRRALRLREGDEIADSIGVGRAILTRLDPGMAEEPFAIFGEADQQAYAGL